jgi:SSS family solute:Na+ symporter
VQAHFASSAAPVLGHITYIAIVALLLNVAVSALFTVIFRWTGVQDGYDETKPGDYTADPVSAPVPAAGTRRQDPLATR